MKKSVASSSPPHLDIKTDHFDSDQVADNNTVISHNITENTAETNSMTLKKLLLNTVGFQATWWLGVLYHNQFIFVSLMLIGLHFLISDHKRADLVILLVITTLGVAVDVGLTYFGVFVFTAIPWWLLLLWGYFSLTLNSSLGFAHKLNMPVQAIVGGVSGCLSYLGGAKFAAVALPLGLTYSAIILAVIWSVLFPVLLHISARLSR
ncbi:DUF2878 domain-containing protein [Shewanella sp. OMA3-2]|uniref:DUF2878 domain-containing protein n=1 Tax=Shewanella sp. OMA3-2 TaxID=2908650 RepID=UPI001F3464AC|nr:DUF2878 domain-containing protein [Shewanella sp. OMA3-2]UJF21558.1 DUF2878 domain-containing protein [Shewanella sp. OMA3-2]